MSPSVKASTKELLPEEFNIPSAAVLNHSAVMLVWEAPGKPNGVIQTYVVERMTEMLCSDK